jgi:hypothetical protein
MTSHTSRTLAALRDRGYETAIVERWIARAQRRIDAFGFADILAIKAGEPILAVQSTGNASPGHNPTQERIRKLTGTAEGVDDKEVAESNRRARLALLWLLAGGRIELYVWRKLKVKRGGKAYRWEPVLTEITVDDFPPELGVGAS